MPGIVDSLEMHRPIKFFERYPDYNIEQVKDPALKERLEKLETLVDELNSEDPSSEKFIKILNKILLELERRTF